MTPRKRAPGPIFLLTDFGLTDHYVGVMKAVIQRLAPGAPVVDLCHGVPAQDVSAGAFQLRASAPFLPDGSIVVAVVDPGVGSARKLIWARTRRLQLLAPDNGLLSWIPEKILDTREVSNPRLRLPEVSGTFHGRDVLAPAAALLWSGRPSRDLGPVVKSMARLPFPGVAVAEGGARGHVIYVDRFGNAVTSLQRQHLTPRSEVVFKGARLGVWRDHYAQRETGQPMAVLGSSGFLELSVRDGRFADRFKAVPGDPVESKH